MVEAFLLPRWRVPPLAAAGATALVFTVALFLTRASLVAAAAAAAPLAVFLAERAGKRERRVRIWGERDSLLIEDLESGRTMRIDLRSTPVRRRGEIVEIGDLRVRVLGGRESLLALLG